MKMRISCLRCVTGETFLTFRNENGLHLSDPLCIMNLTGNNIRHTKESMGSTPADRPGLTGKQSCGPAYLLRLLFSGVSPKRPTAAWCRRPFSILSSVRCRRFGASRDCVPTLNKCKLEPLAFFSQLQHNYINEDDMCSHQAVAARAGRPSGSGSCSRVAVLLPPVLFFGVSDRAGNRLRLSAPFSIRSFLFTSTFRPRFDKLEGWLQLLPPLFSTLYRTRVLPWKSMRCAASRSLFSSFSSGGDSSCAFAVRRSTRS